MKTKKTNYLLVFALLLSIFSLTLSNTYAQAPQKMSYQAVIRDLSNNLVINHVVSMKISILHCNSNGLPVYVETQTASTNANGLVTIEIGGLTGFDTIHWSDCSYYIKIETDPTGGSNYCITGTSQLLSVPYALYAESSGTTGPIGLTGPAGADGATGPIGPSGAAGINGTNGIDGANGATGAAGINGTNGIDGAIGTTGAAGINGTNGIDGAIGATGAAGIDGTNGIDGAIGATGAAGIDGTNGIDGAIGATGAAGINGTNGIDGAIGATGATGATGPQGLGAYAYIYNLEAEVVALEANVIFSDNGVLFGITHTPGTDAIVLVSAGTYAVWVTVSGVEPNQFALFQNGSPIAGATYGSGAGTQIDLGMVIITAGAGDVITLTNHTSTSAVTLQTLAGGTQVNANASVLIQKIN